MANTRTLQRSFGGGEVAPEFYGRVDDIKYQTGLALCRNFVVLPHGPVANRPGTRFVREVKDSTKKVRVIGFTYSTTQTMVIELGAGYFRFHTIGATLMSGPSPYEIANPYAEADLFDIHYVQSADVLTLVHPNYAPRELRRLGATNWQLSQISFASSMSPPGGVAATPTLAPSPSGTKPYYYKVSAVGGENNLDESIPSLPDDAVNNLLQTGAYNTITWSAVSGAVRYNVYRESNGLYGYIGETDALSFVDDNITPDISKTPPFLNLPFGAAGDNPGAVSYFEQRRCFGGTTNKPQNLWMTRSGTESNMNYSLPTRDDDSINLRVYARDANTIRHIVPLANLILLTSAAEWRVTSVNSDAITPTTVSVHPQSYIGASNVQPVVVNNNLLYAAARGGHVRELAYSWQANGYVTGDLSLRAPHLFDYKSIVDMAFSKAPYPICWCVRSDGALLGMTYVPEQSVGPWHQHATKGVFESVCVVAEGNEDVPYFVVNRTINGQVKRYIERMESRRFDVLSDAFFVDCGLTYSGAAATTISGLGHLEGETVAVLADGAVQTARMVSGGSITLDSAATKVHVGLAFTADAKLLPLAFESQALGQGRRKNVNAAYLRVDRSSGILAGPDEGHLTEFKQRTTEPYGTPAALASGEIRVDVSPSWGDSGQILVRQQNPLPLTLLSVSLDVDVGG